MRNMSRNKVYGKENWTAEISWEWLFWGNGFFQVMWNQQESLQPRSSKKPRTVKIRGRISGQRMRVKPDMFWRGILLGSGRSAFEAAEVHFCLPYQLSWSVNTIVQDSVKSTAWFLSILLDESLQPTGIPSRSDLNLKVLTAKFRVSNMLTP